LVSSGEVELMAGRTVPLRFRGKPVGSAYIIEEVDAEKDDFRIVLRIDPHALDPVEKIDIFWEGMSKGLTLDTFHD